MDTLGWDITLDVTLFGFNKSEISHKRHIILDRTRTLPIREKAVFIKKTNIPSGGFVKIILQAKSSGATPKTIFEEFRKIPTKGILSCFGKLYNDCQEIIRLIPLVGKALEKTAPDAFQRVKVYYDLLIGEKKELSYIIKLLKGDSGKRLLALEGDLRLE